MASEHFWKEFANRSRDEIVAMRLFLRHFLSFYNFPLSVFARIDNPSARLDPEAPFDFEEHERKVKQLVDYMLSGVKKEKQDEFLVKVVNEFHRIKREAQSLAKQRNLAQPGLAEFEELIGDFRLASLGIDLREYCEIHLC